MPDKGVLGNWNEKLPLGGLYLPQPVSQGFEIPAMRGGERKPRAERVARL